MFAETIIMDISKEYILCAAVWYNDGKKHDGQPKNIEKGFVVCGRRHHNCFATVKALIGLDAAIRLKVQNIENKMTKEDWSNSQGFVTSQDRFVNRREACLIALENNQIRHGENAIGALISENLY